MAVYIKQSPPREGVRGGWEDFNWESLKSQSHADRDYYLGASAKVGICTRGKFEKFDWWTKKKDTGGGEGGADEELRRVKRFEQQLLDEALGKKPRLLLAGEALPDEEPSRPISAPEAPDAAKALRKLKKEQKRLAKLRRKEQKREARRLQKLKRERRSSSPLSGHPSPAVRHRRSSSQSGHGGKPSRHGRRSARRSRSSSCSPCRFQGSRCSPHRADVSSGSLRVKRHVSEDRNCSERGRQSNVALLRDEDREERPETVSRKRNHSCTPDRKEREHNRRSRSPNGERERDKANHGGRSSRKRRHREGSVTKDETHDEREGTTERIDRGLLLSKEADSRRSEMRPRALSPSRETGQRRATKVGKWTTESEMNSTSRGERRDTNQQLDNLRIKREK